MSKNYTMVSAAVFGVVAVLQALRAAMQWPVQIGAWSIPVWASWLAALLAAGLCAWAVSSCASCASDSANCRKSD
jgi:hypothetical protein